MNVETLSQPGGYRHVTSVADFTILGSRHNSYVHCPICLQFDWALNGWTEFAMNFYFFLQKCEGSTVANLGISWEEGHDQERKISSFPLYTDEGKSE